MTLRSKSLKARSLHNSLIVWGLFAIDCLLGNLAKIFMPGRAETQDEWLRQIQLYNLGKSIFSWAPYIILIWFNDRKFDVIDKLMIFICLVSCWINTTDWITNLNWRADYLEWWVFPPALAFLTVVKFVNYGSKRS